MPVWHEAAKKWVKEGRLAILGVTQEQHPDRCRLFARWKGIDWPILHDPINVLGLTAVPIFVAIDEHGVVRSARPRVETFDKDFLSRTFAAPAEAAKPASLTPLARQPTRDNFADLAREARAADTAPAWLRLGDAVALWGGVARIEEAMAAYETAIARDAKSGAARFRLGVCLRVRHDLGKRRPGDFQAAVDRWTAALDLDPNQYIWRRRVEQYSARLNKPYAFYDWVEEAQRALAARGEKPEALSAPIVGAEVAKPEKVFGRDKAPARSPDPDGKLHRDKGELVKVEATVVPAQARAGKAVRVHVSLRPAGQARWNNEAEPLRLWVDAPEGWEVSSRLHTAAQPAGAESGEERTLGFELLAPAAAKAGEVVVKGYAVYHVCEKASGQCLFRRQDFEVVVRVKP